MADEDLLRRWRAGDGGAGNELVRRHFRSVYRFFRSKLDNEVDDLVQRTFLACTTTTIEFRGDARFTTYLLGIARNVLLQHLRDARRRPISDDVSIAELSGPESPSRRVRLHERQEVLITALRQLPIDLQITLELHYWEQLPLADIAVVLDVPVGTIKSRLARARDVLKRRLAQATATSVAELDEATVTAWAEELRSAVDGSISSR